MPTPPEEFQEKIKAKLRAHYAATRAPLLLSNLGSEIEKEDAWPTDRRGRNLKQPSSTPAPLNLKLSVISAHRHISPSLPQTFGRMSRLRLPSASVKTMSRPSAWKT